MHIRKFQLKYFPPLISKGYTKARARNERSKARIRCADAFGVSQNQMDVWISTDREVEELADGRWRVKHAKDSYAEVPK